MINSQAATAAVGQKYTLLNLDLAAAKIAYSIQWQNKEQFSDVIINLGVFHTICSYLSALGKRMRGSGFEDIIIESGICASGSLAKVMSGKHYNRAMRVHKLMVEALERSLFMAFQSTLDNESILDNKGNDLLKILSNDLSTNNMQNLLCSKTFKKLFKLYQDFKQELRDGKFGKTAKFWMNYVDNIWRLLQFLKATKINDFDLHLLTLRELCPLLFSYDHHNYARYIPILFLILLNLSDSHPGSEQLLRQNGFSVSRSNIEGCRNAIDITIEQTINQFAKSYGGIIGFSQNLSAYNRWCITRHIRASYVEAAMIRADMFSKTGDDHKDNRPSQMQRTESDVRKVMNAFSQFIEPFHFDITNKDNLYCLSSGKPVPANVERDLLQAEEIGEKSASEFIQSRLLDKTVSFYKPLKKNNLLTFHSVAAVKILTTSAKKSVQIKADRNILGQLLMLSIENDINLKKLFTYQLSPIPWSLATSDNCPAKTDKSVLLHALEANVSVANNMSLDNSVYVIDGNAFIHAMVNLPTTFGELAENIFHALPKTHRLDFITDTYMSNSIKLAERRRRGSSTTFLISGPKTKLPRDFRAFLINEENKKQLVALLLSQWQTDSYAPHLFGRRLFFVCEELCICLESVDKLTVQATPIEALSSSQEEADTRIVLHCFHISACNPVGMNIIVRSPDTDVLVILLTFAQDIHQTIMFDTGSGNKRRLLNIKSIIDSVGKDVSLALLALHSFTGCDTTSAFVRRGKLIPKKIMEKFPEFISVFKLLGNSLTVSQETLLKLEKFVCHIYGKPRYDSVNQLRYDLCRSRYRPKSGKQPLSNTEGIDLSLIPPCRDSLYMHILRVNYQTHIWKNSNMARPNIPSPNGYGWILTEDNLLVPQWVPGDILPQQLIDILHIDSSVVDDEDELSPDSYCIDNMADEIYGNQDEED